MVIARPAYIIDKMLFPTPERSAWGSAPDAGWESIAECSIGTIHTILKLSAKTRNEAHWRNMVWLKCISAKKVLGIQGTRFPFAPKMFSELITGRWRPRDSSTILLRTLYSVGGSRVNNDGRQWKYTNGLPANIDNICLFSYRRSTYIARNHIGLPVCHWLAPNAIELLCQMPFRVSSINTLLDMEQNCLCTAVSHDMHIHKSDSLALLQYMPSFSLSRKRHRHDEYFQEPACQVQQESGSIVSAMHANLEHKSNIVNTGKRKLAKY